MSLKSEGEPAVIYLSQFMLGKLCELCRGQHLE